MTKLTGAWLSNPATQTVCQILSDAGAKALFVGGCVRNALLGAQVNDIDIATDCPPDRVLSLAQAAGLKAIPTGMEHGTITVVSDHIPHEITTFRRDVSTDGRRAVVAFSKNVHEDAARRDFTMNALYALADGTVIDPLNGLPDLVARRVRFIGDAQARIREDYLRSLRYFRFHAWYGDIAAGFDTEALAAISANLDGLQTLSRERVGAELTKLLSAADPAPALAGMRQTGVLAQVLPGADDRAVAPLIHHEGELGIGPDPMRRLSALAPAGSVQTLRLSKAQTRHVVLLRDLVGKSAGAAEMGYRHGADTARDAILLRSALLEQPVMPAELDAIQIGVNAVFPVKPADLMPDLTGAALGQRLDDLTRRWIASNFTLTRAELLNPGQ